LAKTGYGLGSFGGGKRYLQALLKKRGGRVT